MPASLIKTGSKRAKQASAPERKSRAMPTSPPRGSAGQPARRRATAPEDFKTSMLNIRVKADLKEQASATCERLGISLPEAIRVFLGRVVSEQAFPFALEVPNAETAAALRESLATEPQTFATAQDLFDDLEKGAER